MSEYYDCYGKLVWSSGEPDDWEETWEPAPRAATEEFAS
jgi:hypothetical protein